MGVTEPVNCCDSCFRDANGGKSKSLKVGSRGRKAEDFFSKLKI